MKLIVPENLDLKSLIKDDADYSYLTYTQGKKGVPIMKKGKLYEKMIPYIYYFINMIIITNETTNITVKGMKRITQYDIKNIMSYKKMIQVIHFLVQNNIIKAKGIGQFVTVGNNQFVINAKYFALLTPYNDNNNTKIIDVLIKTKQNINIKLNTKNYIKTNPHIIKQYELCTNYNFDFDAAEKLIGEMFYDGSITKTYFVKCFQHMSRLKNRDVIFNKSDACGRITTLVNLCPKLIRRYFLEDDAVELDIQSFNIQALIKILEDTNSNNYELTEEIQRLKSDVDIDVYLKLVDYFKENGVDIDRDDAKEDLLWHWLNARTDTKHPAYRIICNYYPNISKVISKLKGDTYTQYQKFANRFMLIESELINDIILKKFFEVLPDAKAYNIYDSIMVERKHQQQLLEIMQSETQNYFNRNVNINSK